MNIQHLDKTRGHYLLLGTAVGIGSGIVVSLFRLAIEKLSGLVGRAYHVFHSQPAWLILWLFVSLVAALFVGFLAKSDPDIKGSGIPQVEANYETSSPQIGFPFSGRNSSVVLSV